MTKDGFDGPDPADDPDNYFKLYRSEGPLDKPDEFCCLFLEQQLSGTCRGPEGHVSGTIQCPDQIVCYNGKLREYCLSPIGLVTYTIHYCPSCGHKFPSSLRTEWFGALEQDGVEAWEDRDKIPEEFKTDAWWKARGL